MGSERTQEAVRTIIRRLPFAGALLLAAALLGCYGWSLQQFVIQQDDWTMNARDPRRTWNAGSDIPPPLTLVWKYDASAATGSPVIGDSILFIGTYRNEVHAVQIAGGNRLGKLSLEGAVYASPIINHAILYIALASGENTFQAINANDGHMLWQKQLGPIETSPTRFDHRLFVTCLDGTVVCLDETDGEEIWKYTLPESGRSRRIHSSPATDGNTVVFGCDNGSLTALDAATGKLRWTFRTGASIFGSPAIDTACAYVGSTDQYLYAVNLADGSLRWKSDFGGDIYSSPALTESTLVIGAANGRIRALSLDGGTPRWEYTASSVVDAAAVICGGTVYVGDLDRRLYAFDLFDGRLVWSDSVGGRIKTPPIAWRNMLFVPVEDKYIYAYRVGR